MLELQVIYSDVHGFKNPLCTLGFLNHKDPHVRSL